MVTAVALGAALLLVLNALSLLAFAPSGHDPSWYLLAGERVLDGARIYGPEVSDTNPPLAIWFSMLPVLLSRVLPLSYTMSLRVISMLLLVGSTVWCVRILRRTGAMERGAALALSAVVVLAAGMRLAPREFGQREHLFVLLALPCLFAMAVKTEERLSLVERCAIGVAAGVAICFKPQYALAFVAAEGVTLIYRRSLRGVLRVESLAAVATCGVYFIAIRTLAPLYTQKVLPLLLDTYWAYGNSSVGALLLAMKVRLVIAAVLVGASFFLQRPFSMLVAAFAAGSVGAVIGCALQRTDWPYHRFPATAFLVVAAGMFGVGLLLPVLDGFERVRVSRSAAFAGIAVVIAAGALLGWKRVAAPMPERSEVYRFLREQKGLRSTYIFSTAVDPMSDVIDLKLRWGARSPCLWLVAAIVQNEQGATAAGRPFKRLSGERVAAISAIQREEVAEDLDRFQPEMVMVEHCDARHACQAIDGKSFDTIPWFLESAKFQRAWSHYRKQTGGPEAFDVYQRQP